MEAFIVTSVVLVVAYLLGSIPTALIISKRILQLDIRAVGDGNMGAHNTFHEIGPKFGVMVAISDFTKGVLAVFLAHAFGLSLTVQFLAGVCAILGHDFPIFAYFRGGQGTATSLGTMLLIFPLPTLIGLAAYGIAYALIKNSNIGLAIGCGVIAIILFFLQSWLLLGYAVPVFLFIPIKLWIDSPRRRAIALVKSVKD